MSFDACFLYASPDVRCQTMVDSVGVACWFLLPLLMSILWFELRHSSGNRNSQTLFTKDAREALYDRGPTFRKNYFVSHHGVITGRQLKERGWVGMLLVLYIVGLNAYVHVQDVCSISVRCA